MVKRLFDSGLAVLCIVTVASTDYANFGALDIAVFAAMGAAVIAKLIYAAAHGKRKTQRS
jgi:hypothetical protein